MRQQFSKVTGKGKARENAVTVNVGSRLRAAMDAAKARSGDDPLADRLKDADIVRDALRHWADDSPYAMDAAEMWFLRASRAVKKTDRVEWATALRGLAGRWAESDGKMEDSLYGSLGELSGEGGKQQPSAEDRGNVRQAGARRSPKAR